MTLLMASPFTATASGDDRYRVIVIKDLSECGHDEYILFTVLWQARLGIATRVPFFGWSKPRVGDQLEGAFMEEGITEANWVNKPDSTHLYIERTGVPLQDQGPLLNDYCRQ